MCLGDAHITLCSNNLITIWECPVQLKCWTRPITLHEALYNVIIALMGTLLIIIWLGHGSISISSLVVKALAINIKFVDNLHCW